MPYLISGIETAARFCQKGTEKKGGLGELLQEPYFAHGACAKQRQGKLQLCPSRNSRTGDRRARKKQRVVGGGTRTTNTAVRYLRKESKRSSTLLNACACTTYSTAEIEITKVQYSCSQLAHRLAWSHYCAQVDLRFEILDTIAKFLSFPSMGRAARWISAVFEIIIITRKQQSCCNNKQQRAATNPNEPQGMKLHEVDSQKVSFTLWFWFLIYFYARRC